MKHQIHVSLSVDIDRFDDLYLRRHYKDVLRHLNGRTVVVPGELRRLCAEYRAKGLEVFPPCDHTDERGRCLGHPVPRRVQHTRTKGGGMPAGAVYVGRPTKWGNPIPLSAYRFENADGTPAPFNEREARRMAVRDYEHALRCGTMIGGITVDDVRRELRGKDLACWCALPKDGEEDVCHAAALLEIANEVEDDG